MGPKGPGAPKVKDRVEKESKKLKKELKFPLFDSFSTLFLTFWAPGPEGPGNSLSNLFPTLGPKGPRTPLGGWEGNNFWGINSMGLPESLAGSQRGVRRCELVTNQDYLSKVASQHRKRTL